MARLRGCCPYAAAHDGGTAHCADCPTRFPCPPPFPSAPPPDSLANRNSPTLNTVATASAIAAASAELSPSEHIANTHVALTPIALHARNKLHGGSSASAFFSPPSAPPFSPSDAGEISDSKISIPYPSHLGSISPSVGFRV